MLAIGNVIDTQADYPDTVVVSALWNFGPTMTKAIEAITAGAFKADNYGVYSTMIEGGAALSPLGTFEGKVPQAALDLVASRTAEIMGGQFTVVVDDTEPKSS